MTDREKLTGILKTCEEIVIYWACSYEEAADYLIANGVTFATDTKVGDKWTPTAERLPDHGDVVLCHHKHFHEVICQWDKRHNLWIDGEWEYGADYVTHWMPLPEPPKEE